MIKTSLFTLCLAALAAGCASNPPAASRNASARAASTPPSCVNETATRLPTNRGDCAGIGRAYSAEAIKTTGQTQAQEALRMLDPTVTLHP